MCICVYDIYSLYIHIHTHIHCMFVDRYPCACVCGGYACTCCGWKWGPLMKLQGKHTGEPHMGR